MQPRAILPLLMTRIKKDNILYAACTKYDKNSKRRKRIYMHRFIVPGHPQVDHIDGNGLNNARSNLRGCSNAENIRNRLAQKNNKSGVRGVYWHTQRHRWVAAIRHQGKVISLGTHANIADAQSAYMTKAAEIWGAEDLSRLNKAMIAKEQS